MVITGVTYNGVALTKIRSDLQTSDTNFRSELWYLVAPATGAHNIVITLTGTVEACAGTAISLIGVNQTSPIDANNGNKDPTNTTISTSITVVTANSWLFDTLYTRSGTLTVNGAQTQDVNLAVNSADDVVGASHKGPMSAGAQSMAWTESADGNDWVQSAVSIAPAVTPTVATNAASSIADTSATGNGNVSSDGGDTITERGFVWSTSANPTTADSKVVVAGTTGSYSGTLTPLSAGTLYHYRAYATNAIGTSYGTDTTFTTTGGGGGVSAPTVTTDSYDSVGSSSANGNGTVSSDGGGTITERGIVISTTANPTTGNTKFTSGGTTGPFTVVLNGLNPNTTYHMRAFATNSAGTSYGTDLSFTTISATNVHKHYFYKIYTKNGAGYIYNTTWTQEILSQPDFTININDAAGSMTIKLARNFDNFGEDSDVKLANKVDCYVVDKENPNGLLLYSGYISGYKPVIQGSIEYIEITLFSFAAELAHITLRDNSGNTTVTYTNYDPSNILKDVMDKYRIQGGSLNYSSSTVELTNTSVSYTFNTNTIKECLDVIISLCPAGWYYRIDADGYIYLKPKHDQTDRVFTIGLNIRDLETYRRIEDIVNQVLFTGGGGLFRIYSNSASKVTYGLCEIKMVDERVTAAATASAMANREINARKDPEVRSTLTIIDSNGPDSKGYNIEAVKVGETLQVKNLRTNSLTPSLWDIALWDTDVWDQSLAASSVDTIQIISIHYSPDSIVIEASSRLPQIAQRIENINTNLINSQTVGNPVAPS